MKFWRQLGTDLGYTMKQKKIDSGYSGVTFLAGKVYEYFLLLKTGKTAIFMNQIV